MVAKLFSEKIPYNAEKNFFESGSFPETLTIDNPLKATEKIRPISDAIIVKEDLISFQKFDQC